MGTAEPQETGGPLGLFIPRIAHMVTTLRGELGLQDLISDLKGSHITEARAAVIL